MTEKDTHSRDPRSLKLLHRAYGQAKREAVSAKGFWRRLRRTVWSWWVLLLVRLSHATLKKVIAVLAFLFLAVLFYLMRPTEEEPRFGLDHEFAIESPEFLATITGATNTPFMHGNRIDILVNGDQFYPAMLASVEQARASVTIEAYIYWEGDIGRQFARALAAKAGAGVPVKILLDAVGSSSIGDEIMDTLKGGGCHVEWYRPIHWYTVRRYNNRTHRKSLIVDGRVGYTGGAGIADHWAGNAEGPDHWRDTQVRVEGPAVATLQNGFARNWLETTRELISGEAYYPPAEAAGPLSVQSILSSPQTGSSTARIMYYLSIACARKSILIANPYFIPDEQAVEILVEAKRRGVDVKIMVAGIHNDNTLARANSVRLYGPLLEAGVEIYEYDHTMMHHKFMVCDGVWSTVGTTNFDSRSFALNDENNLCVYDAAFAAQWERMFSGDLAGCHRVDLEAWRNRGIIQKVKEVVTSFLRDQV